jgi:chitin disaccharide deacetylase
MAKRVVVHEDDVGMNHGANMAFLELSKAGICTAVSVMVPCPWFPQAARMARENPDLDLALV